MPVPTGLPQHLVGRSGKITRFWMVYWAILGLCPKFPVTLQQNEVDVDKLQLPDILIMFIHFHWKTIFVLKSLGHHLSM